MFTSELKPVKLST